MICVYHGVQKSVPAFIVIDHQPLKAVSIKIQLMQHMVAMGVVGSRRTELNRPVVPVMRPPPAGAN